jgi:lipoprotein-anchoring transpeptidase ErfK/SrfK
MLKRMSYRLTTLCITIAVLSTGCTNPANQPVTNTSNTNAPITTNANSSSSTANTNSAGSATNVTMFTLPMLNAFLVNEAFAADLKNRLQLTESQISQLRTVATDSNKQTPENAIPDDSKSSYYARNYAAERVKSVIGGEKTHQLAVLLNEYWSSGATGANGPTSATPLLNVVPTDTRVVVNAPAYRMDIFENGQLAKSYKIGIGYPEFPLPVGLRQAKEIIFNPTWTPPDEPWVEASNKVKVGEKVEAGSKLNPLGIAKIPIGMPSLIHGGKNPAQIGAFASHGCIGLTDAQLRDFLVDLAKTGGTQLTKAEIAEYGKNRKETRNVKLGSPVPIELRYETIVVEDGKLYIYRDVYDMDTNNEENLRQVLAKYGVTLEQLSESERAQVMSALQEMSRDAKGNLDDATTAKSSPSNSNTSATPVKDDAGRQNAEGAMKKDAGNQTGASLAKKDKKAGTESGKVTRSVKGAKEIVIEIAALQGKGYPAPVAMNTGGAKQTGTAAVPKRRR